MIIGQDVSHHNELGQVLDDVSFIWIKATEGKGYGDPAMDDILKHIASKRSDNLPIIGFYHYCRPELGNTAIAEADNFIKRIKPHIGSCLYALDLEGKALNIGKIKLQRWVDDWCLEVTRHTGRVKPFIYSNPWVFDSLIPAVKGKYPLWSAHWQTSEKWCEDYTIWQFTSKPFDLDLFRGSAAELARYAVQ